MVIGLLVFPAAPSNAVDPWFDDDKAPELVDVVIDKPVLKPGETGTFTIRFRDENPPEENAYFNWSPHGPEFVWGYVTSEKLHDGRMVPGSLTTDKGGVTSFRIQFRILPDAPYGNYSDFSSITLSDRKGNYAIVGLAPFKVDDPQHPIDNVPTITGERTVGQTFSGTIDAPGAAVELKWRHENYDGPADVGTGSTIFAPPSWYGLNLELTATATWPDGYTLTRRTYSGYLQGIEVDLGKVVFDSQPTVGKRFKAVFVPNPKLRFTIPWSEIRVGYGGEFRYSADDTYLPFPEAAGQTVTALLSFRLPTGYLAASEPEATATIAPGVWHQGPPSVSGTAEVGKTLKASPGNWSGEPEGFVYQWLRNGTPINMQVFPSYEVTPGDVGKSISVRVAASWSNSTQMPTVVSAAVTPRKGTQVKGMIKISGSFSVGKILTAKPSGWSPDSKLSYQWLRNGKPIAGATKTTYPLVAADRATSISVVATASRTGYTAITTSSGRGIAAAGTLSKGKMSLTGTNRVGSKLTATTTGWTAGSTLKFQWLRNNKAISGATKTTYVLTAADRSTKISAKVTSSKPGFTTIAATSGSTTISSGIMAKGKVSLTGTAKVGKKVTAKTTGWAVGSKLSHQWLRNGKAIPGATNSTYTLAKADRNKKISVKVRASKKGYAMTGYVASYQLIVK